MVTQKDIRRGWMQKAQDLTLCQRQSFLDALNGGKTVGQAREEAGMTFDAAMGCLDMFIQKNQFYSLAKVAS